VGFYQSIAEGTVSQAGIGLCQFGLAVAGIPSYALFYYYYAPAMLGMKTGFPHYVIGNSTFGARGGNLMRMQRRNRAGIRFHRPTVSSSASRR